MSEQQSGLFRFPLPKSLLRHPLNHSKRTRPRRGNDVPCASGGKRQAVKTKEESLH